MSKKSKKKAQQITLDVSWGNDAPALPTVALPQQDNYGDRRGGRGGYGRGGFGGSGGGGYGNRSNFESESDRGPWRRGPSSASSSSGGGGFGSNRSGGFGSNRGGYGNSSSSSSGGGFGANRGGPPRSSYNFRNNNNNDMNNDENANPSENDTNWRGGQKKEAPKISLNSNVRTTNSNPWRKGDNAPSDIGRSGFGSKQAPSFSSNAPSSSFGGRSSFGSGADKPSSFGGRSSFGSNRGSYGGGPSRFGGNGGGGGGGGSRFGGGGGGASNSKFSSGGGFGGSVLNKIDNGTARLSYTNKRFGGIMDDNMGNNNNNKPAPSLQAPSKTSSSRFGRFEAPSSGPSEQTAYPGLEKNTQQQRQRKEKTVEQLKEEIRRDNERKNKEKAAKEEQEMMDNKSRKNGKKKGSQQQQTQKQQKGKKDTNTKNGKKQQSQKEDKNKKKQQKQSEQKRNVQRQREEEQKRKQKEIQQQKMNKKLVSKFNKDCLGKNKPIDINNETLKLIEVGLSQKENILLRDEENYEKIAVLLCNVLMNDKNVKNRNKSQIITLDKLYDIIYFKTKLREDPETFLALVLEIISQIEAKQSCLVAVQTLKSQDILHKYLSEIPNIDSDEAMNEFVEYGLQYAYPLHNDIIQELKTILSNKPSLSDILGYLQQTKSQQMVYTNYKTMYMILQYALTTHYFSKCVENDDEKNEDLAKQLITSSKTQEKSVLTKIIQLLQCNSDDAKDEEDDLDDDDDEVNSHSVLVLSTIISISSSLKNNNNGLLPLLKTMEDGDLLKFRAIKKFWLDAMIDKYTVDRVMATVKLGDWYVDLDARQAKLAMERENDSDYADDNGDFDDEYAGNLLEKPKHKTAADYQAFSLYDGN